MNILRFLLDIYFAMVLGTSGLAKIDSPAYFATVLRRQQLLPAWSINLISKAFPWFEIIIAFLLLLAESTCKILVVSTVCVLFLTFLLIKVILLVRGQSTDCGCYGKALSQKIEESGIVVAVVQAIFALGLFSLTLWQLPLPRIYYGVSAVLFATASGWLMWKMWKRRVLTRNRSGNPETPHSAPVSATR